MCNSWGCTNKKSLLCHDTALTTQFLTALIDTVQAFDKIEPSYLCLIYAFIWFVPLGSTVRIWHNISLKIC